MIAWLGVSLFWMFVIEAVILFLLVVNEQEIWATLSLFVFGLAVHFLTDVNVIHFFKANWLFLGQMAAVYLAAGLGWGIAKWFFYVRGKREAYLEILAEYKKKSPHDQQRDFKYEVERRFGEIPPRAARHKGEITSWIGYWPISVIWTFCDDFLTKVFKQVYELFAGVFQRISNSQFKDIPLERD